MWQAVADLTGEQTIPFLEQISTSVKIPLSCPCVNKLERCPISISNDTHEVVEIQRGMLCKVSGDSDRKTQSLPRFHFL